MRAGGVDGAASRIFLSSKPSRSYPQATAQYPATRAGTAEERDALRQELSGRSTCCARWASCSTATRVVVLCCSSAETALEDTATVQLIDYIARRRGRSRLLWLASFRLTDRREASAPGRRHELPPSWAIRGDRTRCILGKREVALYLAARIPALSARKR